MTEDDPDAELRRDGSGGADGREADAGGALRRRHRLPERPDHPTLRLDVANALDLPRSRDAVAGLRRDRPSPSSARACCSTCRQRAGGVARNVRALLGAFAAGGLWLTPDLSLRDEVAPMTDRQRKFRAVVAAATERRMYDSAFDDEAALRRSCGASASRGGEPASSTTCRRWSRPPRWGSPPSSAAPPRAAEALEHPAERLIDRRPRRLRRATGPPRRPTRRCRRRPACRSPAAARRRWGSAAACRPRPRG